MEHPAERFRVPAWNSWNSKLGGCVYFVAQHSRSPLFTIVEPSMHTKHKRLTSRVSLNRVLANNGYNIQIQP